MGKGTSDYIDLITAKGIDEPTRMGLMNALGGAADDVYKAGQSMTPVQAEQLMRDHIQKEDLFLDAAGTKTAAEKYGDIIIERLHNLDKDTGVADGTHAMKYLADLGNDENHTPHGTTYDSVHKQLSSGIVGKAQIAFNKDEQEDLKWLEDQAMKRAHDDLPNAIYKDSVKYDFPKTLSDNKDAFVQDPNVQVTPSKEVADDESPLMKIIKMLLEFLGGGQKDGKEAGTQDPMQGLLASLGGFGGKSLGISGASPASEADDFSLDKKQVGTGQNTPGGTFLG